MNYRFVRVRERHQVTLPPDVVKRLGVRPGDVLEFSTGESGQVEVRAARILRAGTPEARREEEAAQAEAERGEVSTFDKVEDFMAHVDSLHPGEGEHPAADAEDPTVLNGAQECRVAAVADSIVIRAFAKAQKNTARILEEAQKEVTEAAREEARRVLSQEQKYRQV